MKPFDVVSIPPRVVRQARGGSVGPSASRKTLSLPESPRHCVRPILLSPNAEPPLP